MRAGERMEMAKEGGYNQNTRKTGGIIQSKSKGLRILGAAVQVQKKEVPA
jgi:hypothetical protein